MTHLSRTRIAREAAVFAARVRTSDVVIAHAFQRPPYGGANQFLLALRGQFEQRGLRVGENAITRSTRACVLNAFAFDDELLRRTLHSGCKVVHRVDGPVGTYRGFDDGADARVAALNDELADVTVFQSDYSLRAHSELGIQLRNPIVIPNAVDPAIFHPPAAREPIAGRPVRVVASSWSDNPNKGGAVYRWFDEHLDTSRYEFTFVGRPGVELQHARIVPPLPSEALADVLRAQDVYLTASLNDPCSNALLEALACGLPALYVDSGGHPELVGDAGLPFTEPTELPGLLDRLSAELEERRSLIRGLGLAEVADRYLEAMEVSAPARPV